MPVLRGDPRALREGEAARRASASRPASTSPPRPRTSCGRSQAGGAEVALLREQPALDAGRRGGGARERVRDLDVRDQGRGRRHATTSTSDAALDLKPDDDDGRRRRPRVASCTRSGRELAQGRDRRNRGDDDRRHPAALAWRRRGAPVSRSSRSTTPMTKHFFDNRYGTGQSHHRRRSSARRTCSSPGRTSSSPATAGAARASRCAPAGSAPT